MHVRGYPILNLPRSDMMLTARVINKLEDNWKPSNAAGYQDEAFACYGKGGVGPMLQLPHKMDAWSLPLAGWPS